MYQGEKSLVCSLSCTGCLAGFPEPSESWLLPLLKTWTTVLNSMFCLGFSRAPSNCSGHVEAWVREMTKLGCPEKWDLFPYSGPGKD